MKITETFAKSIPDSKGDPTLEVRVTLEDGTKATASVPSGASTGSSEALELRDPDKGVSQAINNVNTAIAAAIEGKDADNQKTIDDTLISLDGTENKSKLGANAIVGVSMAVCRAAAYSQKIELYRHIAKLNNTSAFSLPVPMILVLEGGKHGNWSTDIQEYFAIPVKSGFSNFRSMLEAGEQIFAALKLVLAQKGYATDLGFEGAYCPKQIRSNEEAMAIVIEAINRTGYKTPGQITLGIDAAASEFFESQKYVLKSEGGLRLSPEEWSARLQSFLQKYPISSMEDIFSQEEWVWWSRFMLQNGSKLQIVGDDLLVTNVGRIKKAVQLKACNAAIIKINQIGTVTETLAAIQAAKAAGWATIVSHRGGETMDDFISDLCVGANCPQCKFGGPTKVERRVKYDRLLEIEKQLSNS